MYNLVTKCDFREKFNNLHDLINSSCKTHPREKDRERHGNIPNAFFTVSRISNFDLSLCSHKPFREVFARLFQKAAGHGAEPHTGHFSFGSFSLCACGVKEKSGQGVCRRQMAVATGPFRVLSHFFFAGVSRKEKVIKKKRRFFVGAAHTRQLFEKVGSKLSKKEFVRTELRPPGA